ncbi:hypothetical protein KIF24_24450 [Micromonospora sp. Llam7]|uniref:hypothetical protein n=1 Tax=Micromonospora tarapacensis TaxID=2835305 RepID=UPI001C830BA5|nr:hypothetical protein [Micromonospora tarapacensis]MBX7268864.1 hypothetical protein [Micromonospora tarapacensis]
MPRHPEAVIAPNKLLRDARRALASPNRHGQCMSRPELADAVNAALDLLYPKRDLTTQYVDHRWVGKLERGEHRWPSEERRAALRRVLGASTDIGLGLYSPRRTPDAPPQHPISPSGLPTSHLVLSHVDDELLSGQPQPWLRALNRVTAQPSRTWPELGPRVREHLDVLDRLQRHLGRSHLAGVDARWSEFMSWIADNTSSDGGVWLERSHLRANEAGDRPLVAYTLMRQSQRALDSGDVRAAIALSRRSLVHGPVPARTRALCLTRLAEALAAGGDDDMSTAITAARRELRNTGGDEDEFARHCDPRYVAGVEARCRQLLGDPASAKAIFEELLDDQPASASIDSGMWHAHLADCFLHHDPERAAGHGLRALRLAQETSSYRIVRATQPLAIVLRPHGTLDAVRAFVEAHRVAVTRQ